MYTYRWIQHIYMYRQVRQRATRSEVVCNVLSILAKCDTSLRFSLKGIESFYTLIYTCTKNPHAETLIKYLYNRSVTLAIRWITAPCAILQANHRDEYGSGGADRYESNYKIDISCPAASSVIWRSHNRSLLSRLCTNFVPLYSWPTPADLYDWMYLFNATLPIWNKNIYLKYFP